MIHPVTYAGLENAPTIGASLSYERIINHAAMLFDVNPADIIGKKRDRPISDARHAAMYCAKKLKTDSWSTIGKAFGRDHATVIHAYKKMRDLREYDKEIDAKIRNILAYG